MEIVGIYIFHILSRKTLHHVGDSRSFVFAGHLWAATRWGEIIYLACYFFLQRELALAVMGCMCVCACVHVCNEMSSRRWEAVFFSVEVALEWCS